MTETDGDAAGKWRTFGERGIYESPEVWLGQVDVGLPSRERVWQHVVRLPRTVSVVLLGQSGVLFVRRYRFIQDRWGYELPGGLVDEGEDAREAAVRELEEEQTGYRAGELEHLMTFQPVPESVDAERVVFLGRDAQQVGEPIRSEGLEQEWLPLGSVMGLIAARQIWDAASVVGLLSYLATIR